MRTVENNGYKITANEELIEDFNEHEKRGGIINWHNFAAGDIYYNRNGEPHRVLIINHTEKMAVIWNF